MNRFIWKLNKDLSVSCLRNLSFFNQNVVSIVDNKIFFNLHQEALDERLKILEKNDNSFNWKNVKPFSLKNKTPELKVVKSYEYNVFQYEHKFTGAKINLGIVLFNQFTNEIKFKFIDRKHINKLIDIFPDIKYSKNYIDSLKKSMKKINNVIELKAYIIEYGNQYPISCGFLSKNNYHLLEYNKKKNKEYSINRTLNKIYENKIIDIFKNNEEKKVIIKQ